MDHIVECFIRVRQIYRNSGNIRPGPIWEIRDLLADQPYQLICWCLCENSSELVNGNMELSGLGVGPAEASPARWAIAAQLTW